MDGDWLSQPEGLAGNNEDGRNEKSPGLDGTGALVAYVKQPPFPPKGVFCIHLPRPHRDLQSAKWFCLVGILTNGKMRIGVAIGTRRMLVGANRYVTDSGGFDPAAGLA